MMGLIERARNPLSPEGKLSMTLRRILTLAAALALSSTTLADEPIPPVQTATVHSSPPPFTRTEERQPCSNYTAERRPLFGDLHVHTAWSFDASSQDTRNTPADAYRFAQGAPMGIQPYDENDRATRTIQLDRPLDFTAVTDHSEFLGEVHMCTTPGRARLLASGMPDPTLFSALHILDVWRRRPEL